jgi:hypothetical protein
MGYSHYVWRPRELDRERWREWVGDVRQIISNLPARVPQTYFPLDGPAVTVQAALIVAGPLGSGRPELNDEFVSFNGGGHVEVGGHLNRLWCETFQLDRDLDGEGFPGPDERGWYFECCKTRQMPYDLAVTASLIRLAHWFPEGVEIGSDGGPEEWQPAVDLCREVFEHAELPFAAGTPSAVTAGPDRLNELLAKRDEGLLAPDEVGELRDLLDRDLEAEQPVGSVDVPGLQPNQPELAP